MSKLTYVTKGWRWGYQSPWSLQMMLLKLDRQLKLPFLCQFKGFNKLHVVAQAFNLSTGEAKANGFLCVLGQATLHILLKQLCLKK